MQFLKKKPEKVAAFNMLVIVSNLDFPEGCYTIVNQDHC